ncbi:FAD:protein FMN transferase [Gallibacterium trehalosifermentans]|uniref:FAD:protein FMN transferase n=1 Tax=Gallibacterium trehalosifermentans TaxID=516935 RepID=A0ABV6H1B7_9PAST
MKKLTYWLVLVGLAFFLTACGKQAQIITLSGKTMGTTYHIKYLDNGIATEPDMAHQKIDELLKEVNHQMSTYQKDSELSLFNQSQEVDKPFVVSADFMTVVKAAIDLHQKTEGALDVTVGPLVNLWGFGPEKRTDKEPSAEEIAARKVWTGIDKLAATESEGKPALIKKIPELYVDLSSIAKGFGVDKVASYLDSIGVTNYLVEIGGEIHTKGVNEKGQPWQIAIEKPEFDGSRAVEQIVGLSNLSMATSGDYRNYFEENGKRFSHEIDPNTGYPLQHNLASITVIDPSCMIADGYATGLFVLGPEKALAVAERENLAIYLIIKTDKGFEVKMSQAFAKLMDTKKEGEK